MQKEMLLRKLDILKKSYKEVRKKGNSPEAKAIHVEIEQLVKDIEEAETEELIQKAKEAGILPRLERIISMIQLLSCEANNLLSEDIFWYIEQKMKYNELRPYKHGDKNY